MRRRISHCPHWRAARWRWDSASPHALCRNVGGASGGADAGRKRRTSSPPSRSPSASARFALVGARTFGPTGRARFSGRWCSDSRFRGCITPRWRECGSIRCASTFRSFVGADSALSRNTLALLTTLMLLACPAPSCFPSCRIAPRSSPVAQSLVRGARASRRRRRARSSRRCVARRAGRLADGARLHSGRERRALRDIAPDEIFAVRANAHYTYVHDGEQEYFCGLSIGAVEARLDPATFVRVHRSHIVASAASRA